MMLKTMDTTEEASILKNTTEYELIQFMTDWGNLSGRRDAETLALMLPDDLTITMADGLNLTKAQYLNGFNAITDDFRVTDYAQQAQIFGTTAIVRARYVLAVGTAENRLCYTATFIKRHKKWDVIALHCGPLAVS